MKKIILLSMTFILIMSCNNNTPKTPVVIVDTTHKGDTIRQVCSFGLDTNFYQENARHPRQLSVEVLDQIARKPVKNPRNQPPPPTTTTGGLPLIFINFNGGVCSGTSWNVYGDIVYGISQLDTAGQQTVVDGVALIWDKFAIVTADVNVFNSWPNKKTQVNVTDSSRFYGNGAGGVSYVGSITWDNGKTPAWVFSTLLGYNLQYITCAVAHEAGHTGGLYHQAVCINGVVTSEYNRGYGVGDTSWAPNMGVGYGKNHVVQYVGPTPYDCSPQAQNDTAVWKANTWH